MKHLATVSAQETKAKGEKLCVNRTQRGKGKEGQDSFKLSS